MNGSHNMTEQCNQSSSNHFLLEQPSPFDIFVGILMILIIITSLLGNLLILYAFVTSPKLRTVNNYFIMNLALSDILTTCLVIPFDVYMTLRVLSSWSFGHAMCKVWTTAYTISVPTSIFTLCVVSIDRYYAISNPLGYRAGATLSKKKAMFFILSVWGLSLFMAFLPDAVGPLFNETLSRDLPPECTKTYVCTFDMSPGYSAVITIIAFFLPSIVMATLYARMYFIITFKRCVYDARQQDEQVVRSKWRRLGSMSGCRISRVWQDGNRESFPHVENHNARENRMEAKRMLRLDEIIVNGSLQKHFDQNENISIPRKKSDESKYCENGFTLGNEKVLADMMKFPRKTSVSDELGIIAEESPKPGNYKQKKNTSMDYENHDEIKMDEAIMGRTVIINPCAENVSNESTATQGSAQGNSKEISSKWKGEKVPGEIQGTQKIINGNTEVNIDREINDSGKNSKNIDNEVNEHENCDVEANCLERKPSKISDERNKPLGSSVNAEIVEIPHSQPKMNGSNATKMNKKSFENMEALTIVNLTEVAKNDSVRKRKDQVSNDEQRKNMEKKMDFASWKHFHEISKKKVERTKSETKSRLSSTNSTENRPSHSLHQTKLARNISVIVLVQLACWYPYCVSSIVYNLCDSCTHISSASQYLLLAIGYLSCAINPFLYAYQQQSFRQVFKRMIKKLRLKH